MGALDNAPLSWVAGAVVTAAQLNAEIRDKWQAVQDPWIAYTPVLTAVTTNPVLGTGGSATATYKVVGKVVHYKGQIKFGTSGFSVGSGTYSISLPVTGITGQPYNALGSMWVSPAASTVWPGTARVFSGTFTPYGSASATAPQLAAINNSGAAGTAWTAGGYFWWSVTYEAA